VLDPAYCSDPLVRHDPGIETCAQLGEVGVAQPGFGDKRDDNLESLVGKRTENNRLTGPKPYSLFIQHAPQSGHIHEFAADLDAVLLSPDNGQLLAGQSAEVVGGQPTVRVLGVEECGSAGCVRLHDPG